MSGSQHVNDVIHMSYIYDCETKFIENLIQ